jgi:hypothetical protein
MQNNTNILKARTVLMNNGIRINWRNIGYFKLVKEDTNYYADIQWKYKAGIMTERVLVGDNTFEPFKFFKQYRIVALDEETYINLGHVMIIEEIPVRGAQEKTLVKIILVDGFRIVVKLDAATWTWWKTTYI